MKMRKIIAVISAISMFMSSVIAVSAEPDVQAVASSIDLTAPKHTYLNGKFYEMPFENYMSGDFEPGEYAIGNAEKAKWVYENHEGNGKKGRSKITTANVVSGNRALYLYAQNGGDGALYNPGAKMTLHFGKLVGDGTYTIQFDMANWDIDYRDYVALNMDGWDGAARIEEGTLWTRGEKLTPSHNGDNLEYYRYTGTVNTLLNPELSFAVWGYGRMVIDNIIIKDSEGTIIFSEGFEGGIPEGWENTDEPSEPSTTVDPSVPKHTYLNGRYYEMPFENHMSGDFTPGEYAIGNAGKWVYENHEGNGNVGRSKITTSNVVSGDRALYLYAQNGGDGALYNPGAKMTLHFGELAGDGTYTIQFDMAPWNPDWRDYVALNMDGWDSSAKIKDGEGGTIWTKGEKLTPSKNGDNLEYYRYTGTVNTLLDPELSFAVWGYSRMVIDNIIIKDSTGTIIFSEGFEGGIPEGWGAPEDPDEPDVPEVTIDLTKPKHTYLHGNFYEMPFENYMSGDFTPGEYAIGNAGKWVYENHEGNGNTGRAKITTANVVSGERALYLYAQNGGEGALYNPGAKMTLHFGELAGDGTYTIQFDMAPWSPDWRDYVALNMDGWDSSAKIKDGEGGTIWTKGEKLTPSKNGDNLEYYRYTGTVNTLLDPELSFAVWGYSRMVIDNIIIKDSTGTIIFSEGFEGGIPEGWGAPEDPDEPDVPEVTIDLTKPKHTYLHGNFYEMPFENYMSGDFTPGEYAIGNAGKWVYENHEGNGNTGRAKITTANVVSGERALYLYAQNGGEGALYNPGAKMTLHFGELAGDGTYTIQFDMAPWHPDWRDFVALNMDGWDSSAKIKDGEGGTIWTKGEKLTPSKNGDNLEYYRYTGTVNTLLNPELSFAVWGYSRMVIDNIIIKDSEGTIIFSEGFEGGIPEGWVEPDEPEVNTPVIHDAEFVVVEKVGDEYKVLETATKLTANTLLMSVVKVENEASADVYTALYKDGCLVSCDVQTVSATTGGEMSSGSVISVPTLDDGEYTLKVFVWNNQFVPIKSDKTLGE